jgi:hypothetical protein
MNMNSHWKSGAIVRIDLNILLKDTIEFELITMIKRDFSYHYVILVSIFFDYMDFSLPIGLFLLWSLLRSVWLTDIIAVHTFVRLFSIVFFFESIYSDANKHLILFQSDLTTCLLSLILMILKDWVKWEKV